MDENRIEQSLNAIKANIPVNEELKERLRLEWVKPELPSAASATPILAAAPKSKPARRFNLRKWAFAAAAAAVIIGVGTFVRQGPDGMSRVSAQSLQVQNQISFVDIGSGSPFDFTEYQDTVYIPIAGKGLFAYDSQGFHQLLTEEVTSAKIDPSGNQLVVASGGGIGVYDLSSKQYRELLRSEELVLYEQPSWKDEHTILYVKKVVQPGEEHGFSVKESGIYEQDLNKGKSKKLGEGSAPSYASQSNALVFETRVGDEPRIVRKALKTGEETVIDKGRFPSVSPDGDYIAYVKSEENNRELKPGASVQEQVDQVWIADWDGETKRSATSNTPKATVSDDEWLKTIKPGGVPEVLLNTGMDSYYNPVWNTNSDRLYVLKNRNGDRSGMSVMRVDLSARTLETEEVVRAFNQAAIVRDDAFLRSLLADGQEWTSTSNPHQVGFSILGTGTENGRAYVDVEQNLAYTANPDYSVGYVRYYLVPTDRGYLVEEIGKIPGAEDTTIGEQRDGTVALTRGDGSQPESLFAKTSIPPKLRPAGNFRLASLAYLTQQKQVVFTLQALQDDAVGQRASVKVVKYDPGAKSFQEIANISSVTGLSNVGVGSLIVSPDGRYAALDLFSDDDKNLRSHVILVDLEKKTSEPLEQWITDTAIEGTHSYYWEGDKLHFTLAGSGQQLHYVWDASTGRLERP